MSYKKFDIWKRAREISIAIHKMTLTELHIPIAIGIEMYEDGNQIRRSSNFNQQQVTSNKKPE